MNREKSPKVLIPRNKAEGELLETLLADLGKNYDPNAALKFLKILEKETKNSNKATLAASKNLEELLKSPPEEDTTLHVIYKTPYVLGEVVLSGSKTANLHPLCKFYPIHFKKTYLKQLSRWETNPVHEAKQSHKIWKHFQETEESPNDCKSPTIPLPLGSNATTYRSQLLEAKSIGSLSPINSNAPEDEILKQIRNARKTFGSVMRLWRGLESLNDNVNKLHSGGFLHNDLHKENLLIREGEVCESCIIDFETSEEDPRYNTLDWKAATRNDKRYLLKEACLIFLCAPQNEQTKILKESPLSAELSAMLKTDPLLINIVRKIGQTNELSIDKAQVKQVGQIEQVEKVAHLKRTKITKPNTTIEKDLNIGQ